MNKGGTESRGKGALIKILFPIWVSSRGRALKLIIQQLSDKIAHLQKDMV